MKNIKLFVLVILAFSVFSFSVKELAKSLKINKNNSMVEFKIEDKLGTTRVGYFDPPKGDIFFDRQDLAKSFFKVNININTLNTNNKIRDNDLLTNFFEVSKFPSMSFTSKSIYSTQEGFEVVGNLKIKDVIKEIKIPFIFVEDPAGSYFKSDFSLNRLDYHVGANNETIGKEVKVKLKIMVF